MHCSTFLTHYSAYRDRQVADLDLRRHLERHVATCPRCRRYDAHIARGVMVLRSSRDLQASTAFRARLAERLAADSRHEAPPRPSAASRVTAFVAVAAALAMAVVPGGSPGAQGAAAAAADEPAAVRATVAPSAVAAEALVVPAFGDWRTPRSTDEPLVHAVMQAP